MSTPAELDLATLNLEIDQLETEVALIERERSRLAKSVARLARRLRYLRLADWFRTPTRSFPGYPLAVFAIGPLTVGIAVLVIVSMLFHSWSLAFGGLLIGAAAGAVLFAALLYRPADQLLPSAISDADSRLKVEVVRLQETVAASSGLRLRLSKLVGQRRDLATTDKLQRAMLLQRDWKAMRGSEWEDYVVEVCRTLGANVQRGQPLGELSVPPTAHSAGPRGIVRHAPTTLFVTFSPRRIAVAAVSEVNPFHTAAVQQTVNGLVQQGCDTLAIITNARVTAGSIELARSRRCTLIGADDFPDFVLGKISL
jgi:hypothetical protein